MKAVYFPDSENTPLSFKGYSAIYPEVIHHLHILNYFNPRLYLSLVQ